MTPLPYSTIFTRPITVGSVGVVMIIGNPQG